MSLSKVSSSAVFSVADAIKSDPIGTLSSWLSWPFRFLRELERGVLSSLGVEESRRVEVASISITIASILLLSRSISYYKKLKKQRALQDRATLKKQLRDDKLRGDGSESQALDAAARKLGLIGESDSARRRAEIVSKSVTELLEALRERKLTSEQIVVAFCLQAREYCGPDSKVNALAETCFEQALEQARDSDKRRLAALNAGVSEQSNAAFAVIRPLEGLPISVKDHIDQVGYDSTLGMACRTFKPSGEDSLLIKALRDAGAIVFTRTNVPQLLSMNETVNHIWGRTTNPWDPSGNRSPGGSTGGEAALIAARGSPIGIGSDIGGSIRLPCTACGIFGLKPTPARVSSHGVPSPYFHSLDPVQFSSEEIRLVCGPMSNSVEGLALVMRAWLSEHSVIYKKDRYVPKVPFRENILRSTNPLKIGYYVNNGYLNPSPSVARALNEAKAALERAGHILVPFHPPPAKECFEAYLSLLWGHGAALGIELGLQGEKPHYAYDPSIFTTKLLARYGKLAESFFQSLFNLFGEKMAAQTVHWLRKLSVFEFEQLVASKHRLQESYMRQWQEAGIDALICPTFPYPALLKDIGNVISSGLVCSIVWNLLHYPAGVAPITVARPNEDDAWKKDEEINFLSQIIRDSLKNNQGLPIGVQVVAQPFDDEVCLRVMKDLETQVGFKATPPNVIPSQ